MKLLSYESYNFKLIYLSDAYSRCTRELAENILAEVKFSSRNEALLKTKQKHPEIFCLSSRHWHLVTESNRLGQIISEPAIVAYRKDKSLKDLLVRAKIPSHF